MAQRIRAQDFSRLVRQKLKADTKEIVRVARDTVAWGVARAVELTNEHDLVDRGAYKRGWDHRQLSDGAELGNDAVHAPIIEYGRRPNAPGPPLQPILEWVERKLVANGAVEPGDAWWVARSIRAAIHRRGLPPYGIMRQVYDEMKDRFRSEIRRRLTRKLRSAILARDLRRAIGRR